VLVNKNLQNWVILGANAGFYIPAPWSIWVLGVAGVTGFKGSSVKRIAIFGDVDRKSPTTYHISLYNMAEKIGKQ